MGNAANKRVGSVVAGGSSGTVVGLRAPHTRQFVNDYIDVMLYVKSAYEETTTLNSVQSLHV